MDNITYENPHLILETATMKPGSVIWRSPSNLAIVKYWGKYGQQLPRNPSISLTLETAFTQTLVEYQPREDSAQDIHLELYFENERNEAFEHRVKQYFTSLLSIFPFLKQLSLKIKTANSFPHSSGIASSASAMSALSLCLCSIEHELFDTLSDDDAFDQKASFIARLGSGSAARSIYPTMALWGKIGEVDKSSNLYAIPLESEVHDIFKTLHDDILIVSTDRKGVSSTAGHRLMDDNPYAAPRYNQATQNVRHLLGALKKGDLETFGKIAEAEALTLHALMMCSSSSYFLMKPNTLAILEKIQAYRKRSGHPVYFSLDAGPNVHVLYPENIMHEVRVFVEEALVPLCEEEKYIGDFAGEGPIQL